MILIMQSGLGGWQIANMVVGGCVLAALLGIWRLLNGKADKTDVAAAAATHEAADVKEHNNQREALAKLETKMDAAMLIVGASITRPELAEKVLAMTGRSDDRMARVLADIVQLTTDIKANAKATSETDKKLDDLPGRVRALEDRRP